MQRTVLARSAVGFLVVLAAVAAPSAAGATGSTPTPVPTPSPTPDQVCYMIPPSGSGPGRALRNTPRPTNDIKVVDNPAQSRLTCDFSFEQTRLIRPPSTKLVFENILCLTSRGYTLSGTLIYRTDGTAQLKCVFKTGDLPVNPADHPGEPHALDNGVTPDGRGYLVFRPGLGGPANPVAIYPPAP